MIGQLTGEIISKNPPEILLDVNGVGYQVLCPMSSFYQLSKQKKQTLLTHMIVREDDISLYGFMTNDERTLFCQLLKVNGIGAKVALAILSTLSVSQLISCVNNEDFNQIKKTPGIGLKTAQKLIVELKDKINKLDLKTTDLPLKKTIDNKANQALESLGFKAKEVDKMLENIDMSLSTEEIIRLALKNK